MAGIKGQGTSVDRHIKRSKDLMTAIRRVMGMRVEVNEEAVKMAKLYFGCTSSVSFADIVAAKLFDMGVGGNVRALECIARMGGVGKVSVEKANGSMGEAVESRAKELFGGMSKLNG